MPETVIHSVPLVAGPPPVVVPDTNSDPTAPDERISESLSSYDALGVYFSFVFHLAAFGILMLVLWALDLLRLDLFETNVDPIRAALADEVIIDTDPVMEIDPNVEIQLPPDTVRADNERELAFAEEMREDAIDAANALASIRSTDNEGGGAVQVHIPRGRNAVTKGSFTAWTIPEKPAIAQPYRIVIEVRLPTKVKGYRLSDLSGVVVGTDRWEHRIPIDTRPNPINRSVTVQGAPPMARVGSRLIRVDRNRRLKVGENGVIQIVLTVRGAQIPATVDTITIRSRLLREQQQLEIRFPENR